MAEYIDRNGLIEALNKFAPEHYNALINQFITKYPTADVVEMKHGEWKFTIDFGQIMKHHFWNCSLCGAMSENGGTENYCPNCGAKMDGGKANDL